MDEVTWAQTGRQRFSMLLMAVFGGAALLLEAIGLYGLIAYSVAQQRPEIGMRMALGAESADVRNMVVWQGMRIALVGIFAGGAAAWVLLRLIEGMLFGVSVHDALTFAAVPATLIVVALVAVYVPANRASRLDPLESLRSE